MSSILDPLIQPTQLYLYSFILIKLAKSFSLTEHISASIDNIYLNSSDLSTLSIKNAAYFCSLYTSNTKFSIKPTRFSDILSLEASHPKVLFFKILIHDLCSLCSYQKISELLSSNLHHFLIKDEEPNQK